MAATGETCNLAIPEGNAIVYVDRVETQEPLRLHLVLGTRAPMHCTASGKLFLAHMTLLERRALLAMLSLQARTPKSITDPALLEREIVRIARLGIGIDDEEFVHGMVAVAVPICAADGRIVAAVACHAPVARKSVEQLLQHVPQLKEAAVKLRPLLLAESSEGFSTFATFAARRRNASGMLEPSSGRRYSLNASVTSVPLALMNSSSMVRVLPATSDKGSSS